MATVRYFSGEQEVCSVFSVPNARFYAMGGAKSRHNSYDGYSRMVGHPMSGPDAWLPVTRKIFYKDRPSLHKCGSKCRSAKGHDCECACGGEFHGVDS